VRSEYEDPITSSYFAIVTISLSLFAVGLLPYSRLGAMAVWMIAAVASVTLLVFLLAHWIVTRHELDHITPAWFVPVAGCAVPVYAAVPLGYTEVGWVLFSAAILCWLTLQPLVFYRLIFHDPIRPRLTPTLAILVSSPAVLATAWFTLDDHVADPVFRILAFSALFLAALVLTLTRMTRGTAFSPAWWGYTFPAAAVASAYLRYDDAVRTPFATGLAWATLLTATAITDYVIVRSIVAYGKGVGY
jgi:tellurite resistance protein